MPNGCYRGFRPITFISCKENGGQFYLMKKSVAVLLVWRHIRNRKDALQHPVSASRGVADVNLGRDAGLSGITPAQLCGKGLGLAPFHQVDGAAAKSAAGEPCADQSRNILRQIDHEIGAR